MQSFFSVNVLENPDIRQGIKDFANWPTIPQLYVNGEFVGGCDIVQDLDASGELQRLRGDRLPVRCDVAAERFDGCVVSLREERRGRRGQEASGQKKERNMA